MPLGRLANAALRERKVQLHDALELLVAVKIRRDGVVDFNARGQSHEMFFFASLDLNVATPSIHVLSLEQMRTSTPVHRGVSCFAPSNSLSLNSIEAAPRR
ncbi:protein of unknown function (plasmid) [Cupriavidus taiwanensis]|uniref:Uncharacterized protein n=1 Tax=Cupriavidus taiwanensis TaxID=164546 RepID=A0A375IUG2_9BURK|nr:protein of unknown function [Cupriavidus taiwanensis]